MCSWFELHGRVSTPGTMGIGSNELSLNRACAPQLEVYTILSGCDAYKRTFAVNRKENPCCDSSRFPLLLSGHLSYLRCHITINKMLSVLNKNFSFLPLHDSVDVTINKNDDTWTIISDF